jgi:hypothetical protein
VKSGHDQEGEMRRLILCLLVVAAATLANTGQAFGATLIVDDDGVQCPNRTSPSIQVAVGLASPGDTVKVCPGLYNETVSVPKTLTITGTLAGTALGRCFGTPSPPNPAVDAIVQGPTLWTFGLLADDIVLENFVIQRTNNGPGVYWSGVFSGYLTRNNIIQENTFGLYANSGGATQSVARFNCFRANNAPGAASGDAIYADQGSRNILIERNRSTLHNVAAAVFAGAPGTQQDITYRLNELRLDNSIVFFSTLRPTVAFNSISNALTSGTAILIGGGNDTALVARNVVNGAGLNSSGVSVSAIFGPNRNVDVLNNSVQNARDGINVSDPAPGVAELRSNSLRDNRRDGIRMTAATSLNTVANNFMRRNLEHDCHDDSVGLNPPALVANFWIDNDGITENRPGLCRDQDDDEACPDDDEDNDGLTDQRELLLLTLLGNQDSDLDGIKDGNDDANGNGEDDEDEDDDDDDCPNDSDGDGEDDEDEDDDGDD